VLTYTHLRRQILAVIYTKSDSDFVRRQIVAAYTPKNGRISAKKRTGTALAMVGSTAGNLNELSAIRLKRFQHQVGDTLWIY
jgi:hypothetical protein